VARTFSPQRILWRTTTYPQAIADSCEWDCCPQKKNAQSTAPVNNFIAETRAGLTGNLGTVGEKFQRRRAM